MSTLFSAFIFLSTLTSFMDNNFFLLWLFFFFTCLQLGVLFLSKRNENLAAAYIVVPFKSTGRFPETIYHQQIMCKKLLEKNAIYIHTHGFWYFILHIFLTMLFVIFLRIAGEYLVILDILCKLLCQLWNLSWLC